MLESSLVISPFPSPADSRSFWERKDQRKENRWKQWQPYYFPRAPNKWPQTGRLKTTDMRFLLVLDARSSNQGMGRVTLPLKALQENPSFSLPASAGSKPESDTDLHLHMAFSVFSLLFWRPLVTGFRAHPNSGWSYLEILSLLLLVLRIFYWTQRLPSKY